MGLQRHWFCCNFAFVFVFVFLWQWQWILIFQLTCKQHVFCTPHDVFFPPMRWPTKTFRTCPPSPGRCCSSCRSSRRWYPGRWSPALARWPPPRQGRVSWWVSPPSIDVRAITTTESKLILVLVCRWWPCVLSWCWAPSPPASPLCPYSATHPHRRPRPPLGLPPPPCRRRISTPPLRVGWRCLHSPLKHKPRPIT